MTLYERVELLQKEERDVTKAAREQTPKWRLLHQQQVE
jgi:hypothetical protein